MTRAFGRNTQGNLMDYDLRPLPEIDDLHFIARRVWFPSLYPVIGQFPFRGDGSEIRVLPRYEGQAKVYAELYRQEFGKDVTVNVDPEATNGTACF